MKKSCVLLVLLTGFVFSSAITVSAATINLLSLFDDNQDGVLTLGDNDRTASSYPYDNPFQDTAHTGPQTFGTTFTLDSFTGSTFTVYATSSNAQNGTSFTLNGVETEFSDSLSSYTANTSLLNIGDNSIDITLSYIGGSWGLDDLKISTFYLEYEPGQPPPAVPEPATLLLLGSGLAGLAFYRRKRK